MKRDLANEPKLIPFRKELFLILKLTAMVAGSMIVSLMVLFLFLDRQVGQYYADAIRVLSDIFSKLNYVIVIAIAVHLIISLITFFIIAILYSHKIAGPMFRIRVMLKKFCNGENTGEIKFRKNDFLSDVAYLFNDFFSYRSQRQRLIEEAQSLKNKMMTDDREYAENLKKINEIINKLEG